jgi:hypothetical protein
MALPDLRVDITSALPALPVHYNGSISNEKDSKSSWTRFVKDKSQKLLSCTKTDYVNSDMTSSNTSAKSFIRNCWFTVKKRKIMNENRQKKNYQNIYSPSSTSSLQETKDAALPRIIREEKEEATAKKRLNNLKRTDKEGKEVTERTWKIHLYPLKRKKNAEPMDRHLQINL